jgi:cobalamin biosynthesis protein CbiG
MSGRFHLGIGHESMATEAELQALADDCLQLAGLTAADLATVASIGIKAGQGPVQALARHFGCAERYFTAAALEAETPRLQNPSESVYRALGCHGVAEAAALAAAGPDAVLVVPKTKGRRVTCAIARRGSPGR